MQTAEHYPVVIVGAGPSGLIAANLLGHAGIKTLLVEMKPGLSGMPKALMVDDEFFRLLHKIGLSDALHAHGVGPISYEYVSVLGFRIVGNVGRVTPNGFSSRTAMFQPEFERILFDGARRFPTFTARFEVEVVGLDQSDADVSLKLRDTSGNETTVRADYVLAADGSHSVCRKILDLPFDELAPVGQRHIIIDVLNDTRQDLLASIHMGKQRVSLSLPSPNGGRRYEFSVRPEETSDDLLDDNNLKHLFRKFRSLDGLAIVRKAAYSFHSRLARRMSVGRVFLLGDAAHVMPIFGSQGMNSGVRDAHNLVWKLARVLTGKSTPALLETYHDERHSQVAETIRVAARTGILQSTKSLPLAILRDLCIRGLTTIPAIRRYFAEMRYIPKPFLKTGVVLPDRNRATSFVGRLMPAAAIREGSRIMLLDDFIGAGWALVGIDLPKAASPPPAGALWRGLDATSIVLRPRGTGMSFVPVDDTFDPVFAAHRGEWLIVRPDRIVAAAVPVSELASAEHDLAGRLHVASRPAVAERRNAAASVKPADVEVEAMATSMKFL